MGFTISTRTKRVSLITDCAGSGNSSVPWCAKVSAIDVTAKTIFGRLYLVPGLRKFALFVRKRKAKDV